MITATERETIERAIHRELFKGIAKHGMWDDYTYMGMFRATMGEADEVELAINIGDHHGPHGSFRELAQQAACCQKMMMQILRREHVTHVHSSYPYYCGGDTGIQDTNEGHVDCPRCLAGRGEGMNDQFHDYWQKAEANQDKIRTPFSTASAAFEAGIDAEAIRWCQRLKWLHQEYCADSSGCDSGDPLDCVEVEIKQAINSVQIHTANECLDMLHDAIWDKDGTLSTARECIKINYGIVE